MTSRKCIIMNQNLKVGLYCRISQEDEIRQESSASIQNQQKKLTDFALQNNMQIYSTYCDDGYSGTDFDCPAFKKLISDIEAEK